MYWVKTPEVIIKSLPSFVWRGPADDHQIYITFDDGPHPVTTPFLLKVAQKYGIKYTFFCLGSQIKQYPDLYQAIIDEGHSVGSHGYEHFNGLYTTTKAYIDNAIKPKMEVSTNLFRPPYGRLRPAQLAQLRKYGYKIIMWTVMPGDFDPKVTTALIGKRILNHLEPGSIIVLHENEKSKDKIIEGMDQYVEEILGLGYNLLSL